MVQHLIDALSFLWNYKKKSRGTHLKDIQDFQHYFETIYNPCEISRSVYDATLTLHKVT